MSVPKFFALVLVAYTPLGWSQCAPGIPGAGNPSCIPPTYPGSPYGQSDGYAEPVSTGPAPIWSDRWGAIAMDYSNGSAGGVKDGVTKDGATGLAIDRCRESGGTHCELTIVFMNQCVAVAQKSGGGFISTATAAERPQAAERALTRCADDGACKLVYEFCVRAARVN
jgi:hypothetical protein